MVKKKDMGGRRRNHIHHIKKRVYQERISILISLLLTLLCYSISFIFTVLTVQLFEIALFSQTESSIHICCGSIKNTWKLLTIVSGKLFIFIHMKAAG